MKKKHSSTARVTTASVIYLLCCFLLFSLLPKVSERIGAQMPDLTDAAALLGSILPADTAASDALHTPEEPGLLQDASGASDGSNLPDGQRTVTPAEDDRDAPFQIHFLDVGQGDAALVLCKEHAMLIDGGSASQSSFLYAYLKERQIDRLDCVVATHPDEDHIGGISGALNYAKTDLALCSKAEDESKAFENMVGYLQKQNAVLMVPECGYSFALGDAEVSVIGPVKDYSDANNGSLVLRITYGETAFLFTGDMENKAEADLLESGADVSATVLKVAHHGSASSTDEDFLQAVSAPYAVISVGKDNAYGHPTLDTLLKLRDSDTEVYRTDLNGTVICTSDGQSVWFSVEKNARSVQPAQASSRQAAPAAEGYCGNAATKKYHLVSCPNLPSEKNRVWFETSEEALENGYEPCANCKP